MESRSAERFSDKTMLKTQMRKVLTSGLSWLYLIAIYFFIFLPVGVLVLFSFQDGRLPVPPFNGFSLQWYETVFADSKLMAALTHSFFVATLSSAVACLLGFLAAYALARYKLPGSALQRGLLIAPMTVSYLIIALGLLAVLNALHIPLSLVTVGIGHVVINLPLCFAIIYASMGDHHINIERAARDLGANDFKVMALVTAPMLMPSILAAFFLSVTFSWDEFIIAFLLSRFDVTLPVMTFELMRAGLTPEVNAAGTIVFAISFAMALTAAMAVIFRPGRSR